MKKIIKNILMILAILLIIMQFIRPSANDSGDDSKHISTVYPTSDNVKAILSTSCNDCHSNKTVYPWYSKIQPVAWWLNHHIEEGKEEINFSEFASYSPRRQYHKMEEVKEMIEENEMPLSSYTWIHKDAVLNDAQKQALISWTEGIRDSLKAHYPKDSLEFKKQ